MKMRRNRGQSTAEYALIIGVVILAIVGMSVYVKRTMQGQVKAVADNVGWGLLDAGYNAETIPKQYEPYYAKTEFTVGQDSSNKEQVLIGGAVTREAISEKTTRTGAGVTGVDLGTDDLWK